MVRLAVVAIVALGLGWCSAQAETMLHLGETATVMAAPDELVGVLRIEAIGATAADAQNRVNTQMKEGLARAAAVPSVTVSTGGYGVWRSGPTPQDRSERWQASQTLTLVSRDGASVLALAGDLQQKGFAVAALSWRLSRDAERSARQAATRQAVSALRGRAEEAAALLDLRFIQFKDIRLDSAHPQPVFRGPMPMQAMASASVAPSVVAEDIAVNASVEADVILGAR